MSATRTPTLAEAIDYAFPLMGVGPEDGSPVAFHGMTLRDYFAAKALQALISSASRVPTPACAAGEAYLLADAMLVERARKGEPAEDGARERPDA